MQLKKIAAAAALSVLLASPCAASPLTETLAGFLDSILELPRALAGLSEDEESEPAPGSPELLTPATPGEVTQTDGLSPDDPTTEKGPRIEPGG